MRTSVPGFAQKRWVLSSCLGVAMLIASSVPAAAAPAGRAGAAPSRAHPVNVTPAISSLQLVGHTDLGQFAMQGAAGPAPTPARGGSVPVRPLPGAGRAPAGVGRPPSPAALSTVTTSNVAGEQGFTGITVAEEAAANNPGNPPSASVTPPDQGLAVGPLQGSAGPDAVAEFVNQALRVYTPSGQPLTPTIPAYKVFGLSPQAFLSDPRAYYDAGTGHWFFTMFTFGSPKSSSTQYIAVSDSTDLLGSYTIFGIDTADASDASGGCPCFGDFDQVGANANGFYITTNQFSVNEANYDGAIIYAISKSELVAAAAGTRAAPVGLVTYRMGTADPFGSYHLAPATTAGNLAGPDVEYFVESNGNLPYSQGKSGQGLEVFALLNTSVLDANAAPALVESTVGSESYSQPPNAVQEGSSNQLQTDFNAVQEVSSAGGMLYAEMSTGFADQGSFRSGVAWFALQPTDVHTSIQVRMANQGYVATSQNLLFPDIGVNAQGQGYLAMALSGPSRYPSAAYMAFAGPRGPVGPVHLAAAGAGPLADFTCSPPYSNGQCRYGDYSMAQAFGGRLYMSTEYISPQAGNGESNWATFVWSAPAP